MKYIVLLLLGFLIFIGYSEFLAVVFFITGFLVMIGLEKSINPKKHETIYMKNKKLSDD